MELDTNSKNRRGKMAALLKALQSCTTWCFGRCRRSSKKEGYESVPTGATEMGSLTASGSEPDQPDEEWGDNSWADDGDGGSGPGSGHVAIDMEPPAVGPAPHIIRTGSQTRSTPAPLAPPPSDVPLPVPAPRASPVMPIHDPLSADSVLGGQERPRPAAPPPPAEPQPDFFGELGMNIAYQPPPTAILRKPVAAAAAAPPAPAPSRFDLDNMLADTDVGSELDMGGWGESDLDLDADPASSDRDRPSRGGRGKKPLVAQVMAADDADLDLL